MPVDYYPQKSVQELTVLLDTLQRRQTSGGIVGVSGGGSSTSRQLAGMGNARTSVEILRVLYSLYCRDPKTFKDPYAGKITRTRARYTFS